MEVKPKYSLFEVTGIELEYMIVDRDTLKASCHAAANGISSADGSSK